MATIATQTVNLTGTNVIVQGSDYYMEFVVKDTDGSVVDLTGIDMTKVVSEFRTASLQGSGVTTDCPVPSIYLSNASQGKLFLHIPNGQTDFPNPAAAQVLSGKWDMEMMFHGYKYRPFQGDWTIDGLQVTRRYNS